MGLIRLPTHVQSNFYVHPNPGLPRNASATVRDLRTKHLATEPQGRFCLARSVFLLAEFWGS